MLPFLFFYRLSLLYSNGRTFRRLYRQSLVFRICMILSLIFWNVCYPIIVHGLGLSIAYVTTIISKVSKILGGNFVERFVKLAITLSSIVFLCIQFPINWRTFLYFTIVSTSAFHIGFEYYIYKYGDVDMYHVFVFNNGEQNAIEGNLMIQYDDNINVNDNNVHNDTQNVHDTTVNKTLKKTVEKLQEVTVLKTTKEDTIKEIRNLIEQEKDAVRKQRLNTALNTIIREKTRIQNVKMTLLDILHLVWSRFNDDTLQEQRETLVKNLLNELVDSTEVTVKPLCLTGIYARILDSANTIDPLVNIKPKWALRRELLNYANKLYKEMVDELEEHERTHLNVFEPTDEDNTWLNDFRNKYQIRLLNHCKQTYIDTKLLTRRELHKEIDTWIDSIIV